MPNVDIGVQGYPWQQTAATAATGASAALAASAVAVTNAKLVITHFSGSCDLAGALYTIESPAGTVIWQKRGNAANNSISENFDPPLVCPTKSASAAGVVSATATNVAAVNIAGYYVKSG